MTASAKQLAGRKAKIAEGKVNCICTNTAVAIATDGAPVCQRCIDWSAKVARKSGKPRGEGDELPITREQMDKAYREFWGKKFRGTPPAISGNHIVTI